MLVSRPCTAVAALARLQRSVRRCAASASSDVPSVAVVILPGLGNDASDYVLLSEALMERGAVVRVAPVSRADWLRNAAGVVDIAYWRGTLNPRPTVNWYLERIDVAVASALAACPPGARVSFVAHSAGGWLARVWLQEHGCSGVATLVTLGSPLRPPPLGIPGLVDQTRGILTYVDANCPGAEDIIAAGGRCVSVAGRLIRGAEQFSTDSFGEWVVGQGYRQVCGDAGAWGDGITPVEAALLPGAEHVVLENVYHSPIGAGAGRLWYGSQGILEQWVGMLLGDEGARGTTNEPATPANLVA